MSSQDMRFDFASSDTVGERIALPATAAADAPAPDRAASRWLRLLLAAGPVAAGTVLEGAAREGLSERSVRRAKAELGVVSVRLSGGTRLPVWVWQLPTTTTTELPVEQAVTVQSLAGEAHSWFETARRAVDGANDETYDRLRDGHPEWIGELVRAAHGDPAMLPDDWRYACIRAALEFVAQDGGDGDVCEFADGQVEPYTSDRLRWLSSNLRRAEYCDQAIEEGLTVGDEGVIARIGLGQYVEASEVYGLVYAALVERAEALEADTDGAA